MRAVFNLDFCPRSKVLVQTLSLDGGARDGHSWSMIAGLTVYGTRILSTLLPGAACLFLLGCAQTYTTHFKGTENPILENGRWINNGLDWTKIRKENGLAYGTEIGTNKGIYEFDDSYACLSGFPPNQEAWGRVHIAKPISNCNQEVEILLRWNSSPHDTTGYECFARCLDGKGSYLQVARWEGPLGSYTYISENHGTNFGLKDGDILKASIVGNLIRVYVNGVEKARVRDDKYKTGNPGIGEFLHGGVGRGVGSNPDFGFTSFTARGLSSD